MNRRCLLVLCGLLISGCVSTHEFDHLRDTQSTFATKADFSALYVRLDAEEKADYMLATKADLELVKTNVQIMAPKADMTVIEKEVRDNSTSLSNLNASISTIKAVGAFAGVLITFALTAIGLFKSRAHGGNTTVVT